MSIFKEGRKAATGGSVALSDQPGNTLGTAAPGTSSLAAHGDHIHPLPTAADIGAAAVNHTHPVFVGDAGSGGTAGIVPAPAAGDAAAGKVLSAAGTWVAQRGGVVPGNVAQTSTSLASSAAALVPCDSDAAIVQVLKFVPGSTVTDASLDFDASDEAAFLQEDATTGTDFVGGIVMLHGTAAGPLATWSTSDKASSIILSNGNLTANNWVNFQSVRATVGLTTGRFMFEVRADNAATNGRVKIGIGDSQAPVTTAFCDTSHGIGYYDYGTIQQGCGGTAGLGVANYTSGDYIQVAVDVDAKSVSFYKNGVLQRAYSYGTSLVGAIFPMACGYTTTNQVTLNSGPTFVYPIAGYLPWRSMTYPTSQSYYVTTSDINHISLSNVDKINSAAVTCSSPNGTTIKSLVSFDGRASWKKWDGAAWVTQGNGLDDLQTGNTVSEITTGLANHLVGAGETYLDFAFDLASSDPALTPSVDLITLGLTLTGSFHVAKMGPLGGTDEFGVQFEPGLVQVKNQSGASQMIKINLI
jgi:hypothetical protein